MCKTYYPILVLVRASAFIQVAPCIGSCAMMCHYTCSEQDSTYSVSNEADVGDCLKLRWTTYVVSVMYTTKLARLLCRKKNPHRVKEW